MAVTNLPIGPGPFPGLQFEANEDATNSLYHEDREVTYASVVGPLMIEHSLVFRAYNAQFDGSMWNRVKKLNPAYAFVQGNDGSLHFYTRPGGMEQWPPDAWVGSPSNTIYNVVDYGMSVDDPAGGNNKTALQAAVSDAVARGGGVLLIPSGTYLLKGSVTFDNTGGTDVGLVIVGMGGSTELLQMMSGETFTFTGFNTGKAIRFKDLRITYQTDMGLLTGTAISVNECQNVSCERVYFRNCPQAFSDDSGCLQSGLINCTIDYAEGNDGATMLFFTGAEEYVHDCLIRQQPVSMSGPANCVGIQISSASAFYMTNTHISDFSTGVLVTGATGNKPIHARFSNVLSQSFSTAVSITPPGGNTAYQLLFDGCIFRLTDDSELTTPGVLIKAGSGNNSDVAGIYFNNCVWYNWWGAGLEIDTCQDVVVTGGRVGSCALGPIFNRGGIALTGQAAGVTIAGVDCSGSVPQGRGTQPWAISIETPVRGIFVRGCDLRGNLSGPVYLATVGLALEITDCAGYNDVPIVLSNPSVSPPPTSGLAFANSSAWPATPNGYYGPIAFYVWGGTITHVQIDGVQTNLGAGGYTLSPGETGAVDWSGSMKFLAVGK